LISVASDKFSDAVGNDNAVGDSLTLKVDTILAAPTANDYTLSVVEGAGGSPGGTVQGNANVIIMLDVSTSMKTTTDSGSNGLTRLAQAKAGAIALLDKYAEGSAVVMVQIVKFGNDASLANGAEWMSITQAKNYITNDLQISNQTTYTNYDSALTTAMGIKFDGSTGSKVGAANVSYFFSDGDPTRGTSNGGSSGTTVGIQSGEEIAWKNFLNTNDITSFAYKIGTENVDIANLNPIAWNGATETELSAGVANLNDLVGSVVTSPTGAQPVTGNILTQSGGSYGDDGAGSPGMVSISYGGIDHMFAGSPITLTLVGGMGTVKIFDNGDYIFTPGTVNVNSAGLSADIGYTIQDSRKDGSPAAATGDTDSAIFTIRVTDSSAVTAADNYNVAVVNAGSNILIAATTLDDNVAGDGLSAGAKATSAEFKVVAGEIFNLKFDATLIDRSGSDAFSWKLEKQKGNGDWDEVQDGNDIKSDYSGNILVKDAGNYRFYVEANDKSSNDNQIKFEVKLSDVVLGKVTALGFGNNDNVTLDDADTNSEFISSSGFSNTNVFNVASGQVFNINFTADLDNNSSSEGLVWIVQKSTNQGASWTNIDSTLGSTKSDGDYQTNSVTADGSQYRLHLQANDQTYFNNFKADISSVQLFIPVSIAANAVLTSASGNVITDPNHLLSSANPWGAVDSKGSEGATVSLIHSSAIASTDHTYTGVAGYMQQVGTYGTLFIKADGEYFYRPNTIDANSHVGKEDVFNYNLTQADGDTASAVLVIGIVDQSYVAPTLLTGSANGEELTGKPGSDVLLGQGGDDILIGGAGNDRLEGGAGNDTLNGGAGNDFIIGGKGNDILSGDAGIDTFIWNQGDQGSIDVPAIDIIKDFSASGGDKLSLKGLLVGDNSGNLNDYLRFEQVGNKLTLLVDHDGATAANSDFHATQKIVLENYSSTGQLATELGVAVGSDSAALISKMIEAGKLIID
jgi:hypothetical protein